MPFGYDLIIAADTPYFTAECRLLDPDGNQIAFRQTDFKDFTDSKRDGLYDLMRTNKAPANCQRMMPKQSTAKPSGNCSSNHTSYDKYTF